MSEGYDYEGKPAAPSVASGAQDGTVTDYGTMPPLPECWSAGSYRPDFAVYTADQMHDYARAAIAAQAKPVEMTDATAWEIMSDSLGTQVIDWKGTTAICIERPCDAGELARTILANSAPNSAPNKALVEALQSVLRMPRGTSGRIIIERADEQQLLTALNAAGVEVK